jgi:hypothetical protein
MSSPSHFQPWLPAAWFDPAHRGTTRLALNLLCSAALLVVAPAWLLARCRGLRPRDAWRAALARPELGPATGRWIALLAAGGVALGLVAAAVSEPVRLHYPLDWNAGRGPLALLRSELLVAGLILCTEIFYRGLALQAVRDGFGPAAVYLVAAIYTLDHVGAPTPELVGSAAAGIALGRLALVARSPWPGLAAHLGCALAVDLAALWLDRRLWFL